MSVEFRTTNKIFNNLKSYLLSLTNRVTDFNVGSVITNLFYSISSSIADLYRSAQNIYDAAFVSTATGDDLDKKVADFNLTRKSSNYSGGQVTFIASNPPEQNYIISAGTVVNTPSEISSLSISFQTTQEVVLQKSITDVLSFSDTINTYFLEARFVSVVDQVIGTTYNGLTTFEEDVDYIVDTDDYDRHYLVWKQTGQKPIDGSDFTVVYTPLSVDATVVCLQAGETGNVAKYQISEAATLPAGVNSVLNFEAITGGTDTETDAELRARVPLYLSSLARATRNSLRFAALSVEGVQFADVVEPYPPQGYVNLVIDDGSGTANDELISSVRNVIDGTEDGVDVGTKDAYRAAGIMVNIQAPTIVYIDIEGIIVYDSTQYASNEVLNGVRQNITSTLMEQSIGQEIKRAKVIEVIMGIAGVINIQLETLRINNTADGDIEIGTSDVARPGALDFTAIMKKNN